MYIALLDLEYNDWKKNENCKTFINFGNQFIMQNWERIRKLIDYFKSIIPFILFTLMLIFQKFNMYYIDSYSSNHADFRIEK